MQPHVQSAVRAGEPSGVVRPSASRHITAAGSPPGASASADPSLADPSLTDSPVAVPSLAVPSLAAPSLAVPSLADSTATRARRLLRRATATVALAVPLALPCAAHAQLVAGGDQLRVTYGPWAYHFSHSDEHVRFNHLLGVELLTTRWTFWGADRAMLGFALFDNSFGQFSQYGWYGLEWDWTRFAGGDVYVSVTAGLLHGYKDPYQDKIPFNSAGIAPVIIPSIGVRWGRFSLLATVLGTNGFLFGGSWIFDLRPGERSAVPVSR